ncbi:MAG: hypothetical protein GXP02_09705, partial [Alphaproteobacteria bacterium]|nr:hypothetical protein [Alphaproteobacteria bacterium]
LRYSVALHNDSWFDITLDGILKDYGMVSFKAVLDRKQLESIRQYVIFRAQLLKISQDDQKAANKCLGCKPYGSRVDYKKNQSEKNQSEKDQGE